VVAQCLGYIKIPQASPAIYLYYKILLICRLGAPKTDLEGIVLGYPKGLSRTYDVSYLDFKLG